jgi:hypothetical protein
VGMVGQAQSTAEVTDGSHASMDRVHPAESLAGKVLGKGDQPV